MDIHYGNLEALTWLWLPALGAVAYVAAAVARRRARTRFATTNLLRRVLPPASRVRNGLSAALVTSAMVLMVLALVDMRWGRVQREVPQQGIEVEFVLDVSRSMLAEDAAPNRLERAKQQIKDLVDEMTGDRVGLVVFAGDAKQEVPLTTHYDDFKHALDEAGPHDINRGGSRLGDAILVASDAFLTKLNAHKAMVIFTDGEDQESSPVAIAKKAHEETGVQVFTVGLGDMDQGARIPVHSDHGEQFLRHDGEQVWSKLNGDILRQVAVDTGGAYIPAGTKQVNMSDVYHRFIAGVEQTEFETAKINQYEARFQWFLAPALLLLLLETIITTWPRRAAPAFPSTGTPSQTPSAQPEARSPTPEHSTAA
ncbi:MAG: VWA domain-containing protein [Planctomycetales bacterium]|nr:VWA domain-containing protein [Planctomycetales bacterium]